MVLLIGNIPMVDQGPKRYCVPATFERYLRYMQIPSDMYILAMAGQTQVGGGASVANIIDAVDGYVGSQNRSMKEVSGEIKLRTIKKYIDEGLPIVWTMFSSMITTALSISAQLNGGVSTIGRHGKTEVRPRHALICAKTLCQHAYDYRL